jgi:dipeptidyl aminopeptidase/acylaminoacyl peptidase
MSAAVEMRAITLLALSLALMTGGALAASTRPFTVSDSISLTRLSDPDMLWANLGLRSPDFKFSPDRSRVVIVTRRGNVETGRNEFRLEAFSTPEVAKFVNNARQSPPARIPLLQFESSSVWPAIDQLTWLPDGRKVAFIGRGVDQIGQIYLFDLQTRKITRITNSPYDVARFAISADAGTLIYSSLVPPDWQLRNEHGYAVESEFVAYLAWTDPTQAVPELRYFIADVRSQRVIPTDIEPLQYFDNVFIAPKADRAVAIAYPRAVPEGWAAYNFIEDVLSKAASAGAIPPADSSSASVAPGSQNEAFGVRLDWLPQARVVDTTTGTSRLLLNAPLSPSVDAVAVQWSPDQRSLVIGPTYLPLDAASAAERQVRVRSEAVAEIDLVSGTTTRVANVSADQQVRRIAWLADDLIEVVYGQARGAQASSKRYLKRRGEWSEIRRTLVPSQRPGIALSVEQGMNTPPTILATDPRTERTRTLANLNPQMDELALATVRAFEWVDRLGRNFQGGLILPVNYRSGERYPVVLQAAGFRPETFAPDGFTGFEGAYAAQGLASGGIMVLQLPTRPANGEPPTSSGKCPSSDWHNCGESARWVAMVESAIDALDAAHLIDPNRVGVIGFSRFGMHVHHLLAFSNYHIAAATICDSIAATPLTYAFVYGFSYPGMLEWEADTEMGAPFWGEGIESWQERSPAFHLDRITTPLRIEFIGKGISAYWDTFANLKRHQRPVELFHIPLDIHPLQTPWGRLASLQGNVDWFRFWLLGVENPDQRLSGQYGRWHALRQQYARLMQADGRTRDSQSPRP